MSAFRVDPLLHDWPRDGPASCPGAVGPSLSRGLSQSPGEHLSQCTSCIWPSNTAKCQIAIGWWRTVPSERRRPLSQVQFVWRDVLLYYLRSILTKLDLAAFMWAGELCQRQCHALFCQSTENTLMTTVILPPLKLKTATTSYSLPVISWWCSNTFVANLQYYYHHYTFKAIDGQNRLWWLPHWF